MRNIVERLQEKRQVEVAKSILESAGYKVVKGSPRRKLKEAYYDEGDNYDTQEYKGVTFEIYPPGDDGVDSWDYYTFNFVESDDYDLDMKLGKLLDTGAEYRTAEEAARAAKSIIDRVL